MESWVLEGYSSTALVKPVWAFLAPSIGSMALCDHCDDGKGSTDERTRNIPTYVEYRSIANLSGSSFTLDPWRRSSNRHYFFRSYSTYP
jgi:hypothetical protein